MEKILALLNDLKAAFTGHGEKLDALVKSQSEVAALKSAVAELKEKLSQLTTDLAARDASIADLNAKLAKADADLKAEQAAKVAAVAAEAKKVNDAFAAMGIDPAKIPGTPAAQNTVSERLAAITDPAERTKFYREQRKSIYAAAHAQRK